MAVYGFDVSAGGGLQDFGVVVSVAEEHPPPSLAQLAQLSQLAAASLGGSPGGAAAAAAAVGGIRHAAVSAGSMAQYVGGRYSDFPYNRCR